MNDEMYRINFMVHGSDVRQQVYLMYELMKPDLEFVKIASPVGVLPLVNLREMLWDHGSLTIGGFQCIPTSDVDGILTLGTSIPLPLLDLSEPSVFLLAMNVLAGASQRVSREISGFGR